MKAVKRSVEMRRQIEEAEKEIQRRKEEERLAKEKSLEDVLSMGAGKKESFNSAGMNKALRPNPAPTVKEEPKMEEAHESEGETLVKSEAYEEEQIEPVFEGKAVEEEKPKAVEMHEVVLPKFLEAKRSVPTQKNENEIKTISELETMGDRLVEKGKERISIYAVYVVSLLVVMFFGLIGARYAISTGFAFFEGFDSSKEMFLGALLILVGIFMPIVLIHLLHKMVATKNYSFLSWLIPDGVSFFISLVFLFVA